jgi:hypothetical protein
MLIIWIGALLIVAGVVLMAVQTNRRGRLSDARPPEPGGRVRSLEPSGPGRRLSFKQMVPGLALVGIGAVVLLVAPFM